jgi:DNA-directed RNA polymerase subunit RPC12/RpoP
VTDSTAKEMTLIACADCGEQMDELMDGSPRQPCPNCGSRIRTAVIEFEEKVEIRDGLRGSAKKGNKKRIEFRSEPDLTRKTGKYAERYMLLDREHDEYAELVRDAETGDVLHKNREKLSAHTGHGDDKRSSKPSTSPSAPSSRPTARKPKP